MVMPPSLSSLRLPPSPFGLFPVARCVRLPCLPVPLIIPPLRAARLPGPLAHDPSLPLSRLFRAPALTTQLLDTAGDRKLGMWCVWRPCRTQGGDARARARAHTHTHTHTHGRGETGRERERTAWTYMPSASTYMPSACLVLLCTWARAHTHLYMCTYAQVHKHRYAHKNS